MAFDGVNAERFGTNVAVDGSTAAVAGPSAGGGRGAVYVFANSGGSWLPTAKLTASDGAAGDYLGGGHGLAIDGDTIVAGAYGDDGNKGSAYTFAVTGAPLRTETAKLTVSDGAPGDFFADSVAIDGDTIVAGASGHDNLQGAVYTFDSTGAPARTETAKLTVDRGAGGASRPRPRGGDRGRHDCRRGSVRG